MSDKVPADLIRQDSGGLHNSGARKYSIEAWMLNKGAINLSLTFHSQNIAIH